MEPQDNLEQSVAGWKENVTESNKGFLEWDRDLIFNARTQRGYEVEYDANLQWGCSPTETLLMSLAGCLAIDVLHFLRKMKAEIRSFKINFEGTRNPAPPQYYTAMTMAIQAAGPGLTSRKIERAISLSQEKYCSVFHSLRKEIAVSVTYTIEETSPA